MSGERAGECPDDSIRSAKCSFDRTKLSIAERVFGQHSTFFIHYESRTVKNDTIQIFVFQQTALFTLKIIVGNSAE